MAESWFYVRHYLNLLGSALAIVVLLIYGPRWIIAFFVLCIAWSVTKLQRGARS